jgi:hypothetical protein
MICQNLDKISRFLKSNNELVFFYIIYTFFFLFNIYLINSCWNNIPNTPDVTDNKLTNKRISKPRLMEELAEKTHSTSDEPSD